MDRRERSAAICAAGEQIARQYNAGETPMYGDALRLPSRQATIEVIRDFQRLLFPIYYGDRELLKLPPEQYSALLMERICDGLTQQIALTMEESAENQRRAEQICLDVIACVPAIHALLLEDLAAFYDGDPAAHSTEEIVLSYPGFFALFIYRIAHELYIRHVRLLPRIMTEFAHSQTGIDINPGATIGRRFFIDHGTGIVIGETAVIGDEVKMYQGTTLGALSPAGQRGDPNVRRHPKVGSNVTIYAGSTLLGGRTEIGDNVVIGGNAFLTDSVGPNMTVSIKKPEMHIHEKRRKKD